LCTGWCPNLAHTRLVLALCHEIHCRGPIWILTDECVSVRFRMEEQRRLIEQLQSDNSALREVKRSKDEAISRLLNELRASEEARGEAEAKTNATSLESERNWHQRELYVQRGRNRKLQDMVEAKDVCIAELLELLTLATQA